MIIGYDRNPAAPVEKKIQSLMESVQLALNETSSAIADLEKGIKDVAAHEKSDSGSGGDTPGGATSYNDLTDKPKIEGVTLTGAKSFPDLNLKVLTNAEILSIIENLNV